MFLIGKRNTLMNMQLMVVNKEELVFFVDKSPNG